MAGVKGRSGKRADSMWADALRRAITRRQESDPLALEKLADKLLDMALTGEGAQALGALKELGDRLDGKPKQLTELSGPDGDDIPVGIAFRVIPVARNDS